MKGLLLFIVALLLAILFLPLGILYALVVLWAKANFKTWLIRIGDYFFVLAIAIDQMGNVIMMELFNDIMITKQGYQFGKEDETISSVLGKNQLNGSLKGAGKLLNWLLNKLDPNHSVKSIETHV
ncbi:MAG: hypothetical protein JXR60_05985 [Bacteroidales bacterium]|nr:hypothetical protein [Bacteroidales bacterium]